jgi:hypothetical protein
MQPLIPEVDEHSAAQQLLGWSIVDIDSLIDYRPEPPAPYLVVSNADFAESALTGLDQVTAGVFTVRRRRGPDRRPRRAEPTRPTRTAGAAGREDEQIALSRSTGVVDE